MPFTQVHRLLRKTLEHAQDVIVVGLAVILFGVMARNLMTLGRYVLDVMVETSIVATLREVIVRDVVELQPGTIAAVALFVIALGLLLRFGDLRVRDSRSERTDANSTPEPLGSPE